MPLVLMALVATGCGAPSRHHATKDDTGIADSPVDSGPGDTATDFACEEQHDTNITYAAAEPCDPTLPWVDVSAGHFQTCAVKSDGCGQCWGAEMSSPGYAVPALSLATIQLSPEVETHDDFHVCALTTDGTPVCWGGPNEYGQNFAPAGTYVALGTGSVSAAAISDDGSIQGWGRHAACSRGPYHDLAARNLGLAGLREDGTAELLVGTEMSAEAFPGTWKQISLGFGWLCGVRTDMDDSVSCLHAGDPLTGEEVDMPDRPEGRFIEACAGTHEACALDELGNPVCWSALESFDKLANPPAGPFVSLACGESHACGLTADGRIDCWGYDAYGETTPPS